MTGPYATAVQRYRDLGWQGALPVGLHRENGVSRWLPQRKSAVPTGYTGHDGRWPDDNVIRQWVRLAGHCNIGLRVPDGLIGLDIDQYGTKRGLDNLRALKDSHDLGPLDMAKAPRSTSRGPEQISGIYWYRIPEGHRWKGDPVTAVELIQHGHRYGVVWPSIHPDTGSEYGWYVNGVAIDPPSVDDARFPWLPVPWVEIFTTADEIPADHPPADEHRETDWSPRVERVYQAAVTALDDPTGSDHIAARPKVMRLLRLEQEDHPGATAALDDLERRFFTAVTDPTRTGEVRTPADARAEWRRLVDGGRTKVRTTEDPAKSNSDGDDVRAFKLPDGYRATDIGNAARLLEVADGRLRHVHAWGKWLVWRDGRWVIDEGDALVTKMAKGVAKTLFRLAAKTANSDPEEAKPIWAWALKSESAGAISAMVRLARGDVLVEHEDLDADPYLLNVRNGTIDLRTGQLRPADPADLCTLQCPIAYNPDARAPLWDACVERWQPDAPVREYVQTRAGAGATGKPTETVDVDYGNGGNGKSKFWGAIQHVLGPYATIPHKSLLVTQRHEQHPTVVADLFRVRLAVASETKATDSLEDESVKNLTGGDRLKGRRMRENPWQFSPTHTLVMFSNHRPAVRGRDEGIWRRLRLVPWEVTIPEDERDDDLATKLEAEADGILRWVVDGACRFVTEGLTPPAAVRAATDRYRTEEDTVGRFIADCLTIGDGWAYSSDIKEELDAWCTEQDIDPPRMNEVTEVLKNHGCRDGGRRKIQGRRSTIWHGVRIAEIKAETR